MGLAISARDAAEYARDFRVKQRELEMKTLAETKFRSVFMEIRIAMSLGGIYIPSVAVAAEHINEFREVMEFYGYTIQCQNGKLDKTYPVRWVAEFSIWFKQC